MYRDLIEKKQKVLFAGINNSEELLMYHLFKRGWRFINRINSGIMYKNSVFFVIKKYLNSEKYNNFSFCEEDVDLDQINTIEDLRKSLIPLCVEFNPIETDRCSWYVCYKDKLLEKGTLGQQQLLLKSMLEGIIPVDKNSKKKIEKFVGMVDLIDSYANLPEYALNSVKYKKTLVKNKAVEKYVYEQKKIDIHETGDGVNLLTIYFRCDSVAPIHISKDNFRSLEHIINYLGIEKIGETDTQVKIQLPLEKNYLYKILRMRRLSDVEQLINCSTKEGSDSVKILEMVKLEPDLANIMDNPDTFHRLFITPDMLDMLDVLDSFVTGVISLKKVFVDSVMYVKEMDNYKISKLPKELEKLPLSQIQKEVLLDAVNADVNYTLLLDNTLPADVYEPLNELLKTGVNPLSLLGKQLNKQLLEKYLEVIKNGLDLPVFIELGDNIDMIDYYLKNMKESLKETTEDLLVQGYSQEQIAYLVRAKSRRENISDYDKNSSLVNYYLHEYRSIYNTDHLLCSALINSERCTETYAEIRFLELENEIVQELAGHLFSKVDFIVDGMQWSDLRELILTKSLYVCCDTKNGIRIQIGNTLYLKYDANTISFYDQNTIICKVLFINDTVLVSSISNLSEYM